MPDRFQTTFHPDYPYDGRHQFDLVILESSEGVRFHFDRQTLINDLSVFAEASVLANEVDILQPIVFTFAPTAGLHYFLMLLRQPPYKPDEEPEPMAVTQSTTIAAIRIAHILDAPGVGRKILHQDGLDVYLRYIIERAFEEERSILDDLKHPTPRVRDPADVSFTLNPYDRYQRSLELVQEINPSAARSLVTFHNNRQEAIYAIKEWWGTGIDVGRILRSDRPAQTAHHRSCSRRFDLERSFARDLPKLVAGAVITLSRAKTRRERAKSVGDVLSFHSNGCRGCLTRLEAVYMPALRSFDAQVPTVPR
jgi:hypothetical protein